MNKNDQLYRADETIARVNDYVGRGFSCAETTIRVLMDTFGFEADDEMLRMTSTFRGGAGIDGKCGIVESALVFLSFLSVQDGYKCSQQLLTEYSKQLHQDMMERLGGYSCAYLWELFISQNQDVDINRNVDCVIEDGIALTVDSIYRIMGRMKDDDRAC